jgi:predicted membrane protein
MQLLYVVLALVIVAVAAGLMRSYLPAEGSLRTIPSLVVALIVVGMILWLINSYVPMAASIKTILNIVVVVGTCVGVLKVVGLWGQVVSAWSRLTYRLSHGE